MTKLSESSLYREALEALQGIKDRDGRSLDVLAIARLLLYVAPLELPESLFPFVGSVGDPRDVAVVDAYKSAFEAVVNGDSDDEY